MRCQPVGQALGQRREVDAQRRPALPGLQIAVFGR
jgi:hypothetical protein